MLKTKKIYKIKIHEFKFKVSGIYLHELLFVENRSKNLSEIRESIKAFIIDNILGEGEDPFLERTAPNIQKYIRNLLFLGYFLGAVICIHNIDNFILSFCFMILSLLFSDFITISNCKLSKKNLIYLLNTDYSKKFNEEIDKIIKHKLDIVIAKANKDNDILDLLDLGDYYYDSLTDLDSARHWYTLANAQKKKRKQRNKISISQLKELTKRLRFL